MDGARATLIVRLVERMYVEGPINVSLVRLYFVDRTVSTLLPDVLRSRARVDGRLLSGILQRPRVDDHGLFLVLPVT